MNNTIKKSQAATMRGLKQLKQLTALLIIISSLTFSLHAQVYTNWTNTGSGDWNIAANWDNGMPADDWSSYAYINNGGTAIISGSAAWCS